jgi:hypothetical protein
VILLPLGGFALGIGWLVGLILLWSSRLWTTRDKLIGTLITPGGTSTATTVLYIALAVVLLLGPIVSAVYLARRAGKNSPSIATATL